MTNPAVTQMQLATMSHLGNVDDEWSDFGSGAPMPVAPDSGLGDVDGEWGDVESETPSAQEESVSSLLSAPEVKPVFFSNEECAAAVVAIIRAISNKLYLSDSAGLNSQSMSLNDVTLRLVEAEECAGHSEALLDYALRRNLSPDFLLIACNRPVSIHERLPATVIF